MRTFIIDFCSSLTKCDVIGGKIIWGDLIGREGSEARKKGVGGKTHQTTVPCWCIEPCLPSRTSSASKPSCSFFFFLFFPFFFFATINLPDRMLPNLAMSEKKRLSSRFFFFYCRSSITHPNLARRPNLAIFIQRSTSKNQN